MNFKNAYKNMQNDIEPKREILNNLSYKEDKNTQIYTKRRFAHLFALMLIMVVSVSFVYFSNSSNQIDTKDSINLPAKTSTDISKIETKISALDNNQSANNIKSRDINSNEISYDNYADYIGYDILSFIKIPKDLTVNSTKINYTIDTTDDRAFFNFASYDGQRYINIITTKSGAYSGSYADYNLYKKGDLNIFAFFEGFEKEEIISFENSIK